MEHETGMGVLPLAGKRQRIGVSTPESFEAYEKLRLKWRNELPGTLKGCDCPQCKNRGYFTQLRGGALVSVECSCMARRRSIRRMEKSGLGDLLARCTFQTFEVREPWQKRAKQKALDYLHSLEDSGGKWFFAAGCAGSGKTHLCTAICGELLNAGLEVRYMRWKDDGGRLKAAVNDSIEYERMIKPLKEVRVLYIDDLWKAGYGKISKADIDLAFELLNARYISREKITIISTEFTLDEILSIDEAVGSRIYERANHACIELDGDKNWRLRP